MKSSNTARNLAYLIVSLFFVVLLLVLFPIVDLDPSERDTLHILIGHLSAYFNIIIGYYFGQYFSKEKK